jgi:drug/metabolite transporter (DMT)-like permease
MLLALVSAALFGAATPLAKDLLDELPPTVLAGLFYLGAALFLSPVLVRGLVRGERSSFPADRRNRLLLVGAVVFGGIVGPVLMLLGLRMARAASVSLWLNLETTATAVLGVWVFKEHLGRWGWVGNFGVLAAGVLLSLEGGASAAMGGLLVAAAAVCWGLDNHFTALIDGITPLESTFWKGLVAGTTNLGLGLAWYGTGPVGTAWLLALAVGGLSYGVSIVLYISSAQLVGATRSQMVFASSPLVGVLLSIFWLGEPFSGIQLLAAVLLVASIALLFLERHEHEHVHEPVEHEHSHRHDDGHHDHDHPGLDRSRRHSHRHRHERLAHRHPHWPDLHHRHSHRA